eukprot:m.58020 g.58020  ORF g.58020 m.58020 type:complete len:65 (-) comp11649_c0_seq1:453-647(-)
MEWPPTSFGLLTILDSIGWVGVEFVFVVLVIFAINTINTQLWMHPHCFFGLSLRGHLCFEVNII